MTCDTGKVAYPSPQAAYAAAAILRRKRMPRSRDMAGHSTKAIHHYRCSRCDAWHVTSSRDDDPRARTA